MLDTLLSNQMAVALSSTHDQNLCIILFLF